MMTSEEVANRIYRAVVKRKRILVLTAMGKVAVWLNKVLPALADRLVFKVMAKEAHAPHM
jgi:short-subunit dehydrogenase